MSFLLPHFLKEGRGELDTYFTRVYNPVWTNPDGHDVDGRPQGRGAGGPARRPHPDLERDGRLRGLRPAHGPRRRAPRHPEPGDAFRPLGQLPPARRCAPRASGGARRSASPTRRTRARSGKRTSSGSSCRWRIDPDGALGIRRWFESPYRPGEKLTVDGVLPLDLRERGARAARRPRARGADAARVHAALRRIPDRGDVREHMRKAGGPCPAGRAARIPSRGGVDVGGKAGGPRGRRRGGGRLPDAVARASRFYSRTLEEWGWPRGGAPRLHPQPRPSRRHWTPRRGEMLLPPTFRLPTLIHTRSGNAKYLNEISHRNPLWIHTERRGAAGHRDRRPRPGHDRDRPLREPCVGDGVDRARSGGLLAPPGALAAARRRGQPLVDGRGAPERRTRTTGSCAQVRAIGPFPSDDPDSCRIFWSDGGVHQNLAFPVHPDPAVGDALLAPEGDGRARPGGDRYGDVYVDTSRSMAVYREWLARARPGRPGPAVCGGRSGSTAPCGRRTRHLRHRRSRAADGSGPPRTSSIASARDRPRASCSSSPTSWPAASAPSLPVWAPCVSVCAGGLLARICPQPTGGRPVPGRVRAAPARSWAGRPWATTSSTARPRTSATWSCCSSRERGAEGAVPAPAGRRVRPELLRDDGARPRRLEPGLRWGRRARADGERPRHRRAQVVHVRGRRRGLRDRDGGDGARPPARPRQPVPGAHGHARLPPRPQPSPRHGQAGSGHFSHAEVALRRLPRVRASAPHRAPPAQGFALASSGWVPGASTIACRWVGVCERALPHDHRSARARREAGPGRPPAASKQAVRHAIADSRAEIDAARLLVLRTAAPDRRAEGAKAARSETSRVIEVLRGRGPGPRAGPRGAGPRRAGLTDDTILSLPVPPRARGAHLRRARRGPQVRAGPASSCGPTAWTWRSDGGRRRSRRLVSRPARARSGPARRSTRLALDGYLSARSPSWRAR